MTKASGNFFNALLISLLLSSPCLGQHGDSFYENLLKTCPEIDCNIQSLSGNEHYVLRGGRIISATEGLDKRVFEYFDRGRRISLYKEGKLKQQTIKLDDIDFTYQKYSSFDSLGEGLSSYLMILDSVNNQNSSGQIYSMRILRFAGKENNHVFIKRGDEILGNTGHSIRINLSEFCSEIMEYSDKDQLIKSQTYKDGLLMRYYMEFGGGEINYYYNDFGLITEIEISSSQFGGPLKHFVYSYNQSNQLERVAELISGDEEIYSYR